MTDSLFVEAWMALSHTHDLLGSRRGRVDATAAELVRATMSPDWTPTAASARLLRRARGDRNVLLVLRARVARHLVNAPSVVGQRAVATLDQALRPEGRET